MFCIDQSVASDEQALFHLDSLQHAHVSHLQLYFTYSFLKLYSEVLGFFIILTKIEEEPKWKG